MARIHATVVYSPHKCTALVNWQLDIQGFEGYLRLECAMADNTVEAYLRDVQKVPDFLQLHGYDLSAAQVELRHLSALIHWLNDLGLGARSQARLLSALKTFYRYLLTENLIQEDPTALLQGPRLPRKIPDVLAYEEIQQMLQSIDLSRPQGPRNRAMLETLYACGLRASELVGLKSSNYYPDDGFVKVIGKGNKERIVPIGDVAIKYVNLYRNEVKRQGAVPQKGQEDFLFLNQRGHQLTRVMLFLIVKNCAQAANLDKKVSPHTFRHSFATHLIEGGADLKAVQDMLGHESIITTEIYTHLDTDYLRDTIMTFHPRNRRAKG